MAVSLELEKAVGDPVMGIDEAGRGPLAGGVYAAAVSVPLALAEQLLVGAWSEINDSKKLTEKKRERLAAVIKSTDGCRWAVASASPKEIDELNILNATHLAMRRAADEVGAEHVLVDGLPVKTLPHGRFSRRRRETPTAFGLRRSIPATALQSTRAIRRKTTWRRFRGSARVPNTAGVSAPWPKLFDIIQSNTKGA